MARKKKKVPGLNSSSTADISFILLIFFLVTTSMDTDMGLARRLPQPPEPNQEDAQIDVKERNVLNVRLNAAGYLMVNHDFIDVNQLRERAKEFIQNKNNDPHLPELHAKVIDLLGTCYVTDKHVISVQTDRGTPYNISRCRTSLWPLTMSCAMTWPLPSSVILMLAAQRMSR